MKSKEENLQQIIRVESLSKSYQKTQAVDGISFSVHKGQCFGLLGPNGAGKTTTIEMLEGIVKKDSGEIFYEDKPLSKETLNKIGIQFQHTAIQDFLTSRETIELFRSFYPSPQGTDELIKLCELQEFSERDHRKLSGGQKQRLLLALALVNDPDILFLDEPTTGLDPHARRQFWQLINDIKEKGKTIILTTHYMDEAEQLCDYIVIMDKGKIIERGEPKQLLADHFPGVLIRLPQQSLPDSLQQKYTFVDVGKHLEFNTENIETTLKELVECEAQMDGMQVKTANLDDLFLKLTGHALRESNA